MSIRKLLETEHPLVLPGAHDALSAMLIKQAGFKGYFVGGFPVVGIRYGLPDIGIAGLGEMLSAVRDIVNVSDLPVLVDADNGYGDAKTVAHTIRSYERLGVSAFMMEDQVLPKRCGHMAGKELISTEQMVKNIRAAQAARENPDTFLIARTDARADFGMDEAFRRAERYLQAGADGLFIESPLSVEELELIGSTFDVPQMANMLEGGKTPILKPAELDELGFEIVIYGISLLMRITKVMQQALADIKSGELALLGSGVGFDEYQSIIGLGDWTAIEENAD